MSEKHFIAPSNSGSSRRMLRRNSAPSTENLASLEESFADLKQTSSTRLPLHSPSTAASVSLQAARTHQHRLNAAQEQRTYHDSCQRLLTHISSVLSVCEELRNVNKNRFPVQYPVLRRAPARQILDAQADARLETASQPEFSSIIQQAKKHFNEFETAREFSILNLDVKVGHASTDLSTLEKQSIANLLDDKLSSCQRHLDNLRARVADTSSKVLVTGDLNSGKSTFVNALLKRELLPVDQQPCTSMFCEVLDANLNNGVEQVHAIPNVEKYNRLDPSTYHVIEMRHLYKVVTEQNDEYKMLKVYARDSRSAQESLLHNGVVDIALIDSPGLNTDSLKTTAVFARQEEIDVVVFVVSAENHFTLSGKEFLWNAANEKTHIFIVVNRFDSIRDKDRCKRLVLEQIRQLSPATYADADDLVHFVSAGTVDLEPGAHKIDAPEFARLEQRLRAFVLENRTKSKLLPAKNYMSNLLKDIECLSELNRASAARELEMASCALKSELPAYENLLRLRDRLLHQVEKMADNATTQVEKDTIKRLNLAVEQIDSTVSNIEYPGVFLIWQYAQDLADSMSRRLLKEVRLAENYARQETQNSLDRIHQLGIENLGNYPLCANVDKMLLKNRDRTVVIQVEPSDFFDLVLDEKLSGCMLSLGAAAAFGGRMIGFKDAMSSLWSVSTSMGAQNMRRLLVPMLSIAGAGFLLYVISDMRYAVERKLVKKFKASVRDSSYVDAQGRRMARESRKVLRVEGYEIQSRIQKEIEKMEQRRGKMQAIVETSEESIKFFAALLEKSGLLLDKVSSVHIDGYTHQKTLRAP